MGFLYCKLTRKNGIFLLYVLNCCYEINNIIHLDNLHSFGKRRVGFSKNDISSTEKKKSYAHNLMFKICKE